MYLVGGSLHKTKTILRKVFKMNLLHTGLLLELWTVNGQRIEALLVGGEDRIYKALP